MIDRLRSEPVLVNAVVAAIVVLVAKVAFDVEISAEEALGFIGVLLGGAFTTRRKVTPNRNIDIINIPDSLEDLLGDSDEAPKYDGPSDDG